MAINCFVVPGAMFGLVGVTAIDASVALVTVRVVGPEKTVPRFAVIVVVPATTDVASSKGAA